MTSPSIDSAKKIGEFTVHKVTIGEIADTMQKLKQLPLLFLGANNIDRELYARAVSECPHEVIALCAAFTREDETRIRAIDDFGTFIDLLITGFEVNRFLEQLNIAGQRISAMVKR